MEMGSTTKIYYNPMHPYTKMLMASVPRLDKKWEEVKVELKAEYFKLVNGCLYYDRCPSANKKGDCKTNRPSLIEVEPDHFVACCICK